MVLAVSGTCAVYEPPVVFPAASLPSAPLAVTASGWQMHSGGREEYLSRRGAASARAIIKRYYLVHESAPLDAQHV